MMAYEQKDMSGSAFVNDRRQTESHAHFTGNGMIFGREVWINVWIKQNKDGSERLSFSFREKERRMESERPVSGVPSLSARFSGGDPAPAKPTVVDDDSIPF